MYWLMVLQQLMIIMIAMNHITNTFACFSSGFCSCPTTIATCSCAQHIPLQRESYVAPHVLHKLPSLLVPPTSSYSAPYSAYQYHPVNTAPFASVSYPQTYNLPYTYNAPQSIPQQPMLPPLLSYNDQRSTGNIMGTPENYNSPYHIYRIHSQELPPNTVAKVPPIHKQQKYPNEYDKILHQIEVAPSIITSESINDINQKATKRLQHTNATLSAQNFVIVPGQQHSIGAANSASHQAQAIISTATNKKNYQHGITLQRRIFTNQNITLIRGTDNSKRRHDRKLLPCSRSITKSANHNSIPISDGTQSTNDCIALLRSSTSSESNDKFNMETNTLNGKYPETNFNLNERRGNTLSVRNGIRMIPRIESLKHLKSSDATSFIDNDIAIASQRNSYDNNKLLQKHQNSEIAENILQKGKNINSIDAEKYINQNTKAMFGKEAFNEILSSDLPRTNDQSLSRSFGRTKNGAMQWIDYENRFYSTYQHQKCIGRVLGYLRNGTVMSAAQKCEDLDCDATNVRISGDRILEITFLKNITGRFRNHGNYCVSKKSIGEIKSGHAMFGTNGFSQTRQFDDLIRKNIHYHEYREVNKRKGQTVRSMKPLLVDGTARVL